MGPKPQGADRPSRATFMTGAAASATAFASIRINRLGAQTLKKIIIAEPVHQVGYLPLYMAIDNGFFAKRGLDVSTLTATGGAHVTALVSGSVWGNIGGPESDAMANGNGNGSSNPLVSICNVVNRCNNYVLARKGLVPKSSSDADMAALMKGKRIALNRFGGTPDVCGRWYIEKVGLKLGEMELINNADSAATPVLVKQGQADFAISSEPQITYGKELGIWDEPMFGFPTLGEYSYSVISVRKSTTVEDAATVQAFTDALLEALKIATTSRTAVDAAARKAFPTLAASGIKGALDRTIADRIWSSDGFISEKGYNLDMSIVAKSGEFTKSVPYSSVIDMTWVKKRIKSA
jgi:NitT/TauT family transport system substrate-binding protein